MRLVNGSLSGSSPDYCIDANQLDQAELEREVVRYFR